MFIDISFINSIDISIHALRGEGDYGKFLTLFTFDISIHALRGEGDAVNRLKKQHA